MSEVSPEFSPSKEFDRSMHALRVADPFVLPEVIDAWTMLNAKHMTMRERQQRHTSTLFRIAARAVERECFTLRAALESSVLEYLSNPLAREPVEAAVRAINEYLAPRLRR